VPRYTPGPWKIRPNGELWSYSRGGSPQQIGTMFWSGKSEERDGNGRIIAGAADPGKPCVIDVCRDLFHLDNDYVVAVQLPTPRFARGGLAHHGDPVKLLVVLFEIVVVQFTQSMIQAHDVAGQLQPVRIASYRLIAL